MRRLAALVIAAVAAAAVQTADLARPAQADDSSTLTVVGTSDVYDSNLVQSVIKPGFEAAHPQYRLDYVSKGTGAAIAYAEAGTASALLVHAASLENRFVGAGYSAEVYGRAVFYGDYVLVGPASDPAGVLTSAPHDVVGAFERIAAAGAAGRANFVSRGGTPGTTVAEHAIWALSNGVPTCTVSADNGGGTSPSTSTGTCPQSIPYPAWYHATGLTQGPNLVNADSCSYSGGGCYAFTDRGTFDYLRSTGAVTRLGIVTRDNAAGARGGSALLVNSFHAYAVNPKAFSPDTAARINAPAAAAFLDWLTSPAAQQRIAGYLAADGAPFLPDAQPRITTSPLPRELRDGQPLAVSGTVQNVAPGTPALAGVSVSLTARGPGEAQPHVVATTTTDRTGAFGFQVRPRRTATYAVTTNRISQIEDPTLSPVFGDLLVPASRTLGAVVVDVAPSLRLAPAHGVVAGQPLVLTVSGTPEKAVDVLGRRPRERALRVLATVTLPESAASAVVRLRPAGTLVLQARQRDTGVASTAVVAVVRSAVSLGARRVGPRTYLLRGGVLPRARELVRLYAVDGRGRRTLLRVVRTDARGTFRAVVAIRRRGARSVVAVSAATPDDASGTSTRVRLSGT